MKNVMANKDYAIVVGLDIGTAFTKVVICKLINDNIEILGLSKTKTEGVIGGNITNLFKLEETINNAISSAEDSAGINIKSVNIAIFGNYVKIGKYHCSTKVTNYNGIITKNDVNKLYRDISNITTQPNCQILNIVPIFYSTDSIKNIPDPVGMISGNLTGEYSIIYAQSNILKQFTECLNNCNLDIEAIISIPESLANVILSKEEKDFGTCILDMGAGSTVLSIFKNNSIQHAISVPFGGNAITNDLKNAFSLTFDQAEKLKINYAETLLSEVSPEDIVELTSIMKNNTIKIYKYDIVQIISSRVKEIMKIMSNELLKQKISLNSKMYDVHMVGGCSKIKNICQLLSSSLGCHCHLATLNNKYRFLDIDACFYQSLGSVIDTKSEVEEDSRFDTVQHSKKSISQGSFFKNLIYKTKKFLVD